jgi:hypothetical protein
MNRTNACKRKIGRKVSEAGEQGFVKPKQGTEYNHLQEWGGELRAITVDVPLMRRGE